MTSFHSSVILTIIVVPCKVTLTYKEVMILIKFPEFAVYYVEVLIGEVIQYLVDVFLNLKPFNGLLIKNIIII